MTFVEAIKKHFCLDDGPGLEHLIQDVRDNHLENILRLTLEGVLHEPVQALPEKE